MTETWVEELKTIITDPRVLMDMLEIQGSDLEVVLETALHFPLRVTKSFIEKMKKKDINDPLLKQVLPLKAEQKLTPGFSLDPLNEKKYNPVSGLLHKYAGRVLLTLTGGCAIHCRYCFRQNFPYQANIPGKKLGKILSYLEKDTSIREIILSGGDPLLMKDAYLEYVFQQLANIKHLEIVRIHSRLPIVLPSRITENFIQSITKTRLKCVLVTHCNHSNELDALIAENAKRLVSHGITLLNQTVLLKGINDSVEVLKSLSYDLFSCQIMPYYLHCLDKVQGTAHFDIATRKAKALYYQLRACLPGYLVPLLVKETEGILYKAPII